MSNDNTHTKHEREHIATYTAVGLVSASFIYGIFTNNLEIVSVAFFTGIGFLLGRVTNRNG